MMRKAPGFSAAIIVTPALGIGANSAVFALRHSRGWGGTDDGFAGGVTAYPISAKIAPDRFPLA
jgi:hypothetical protein